MQGAEPIILSLGLENLVCVYGLPRVVSCINCDFFFFVHIAEKTASVVLNTQICKDLQDLHSF